MDGRRPSVPTGHGAAFVAVDIGAMMPIGEFKRRVDAMAEEIRQSPRAEGADRIYLPGEMEWERRQKALSEGIVLAGGCPDLRGGAGEGFGHRSGILVRVEGPSPGTAPFRLYNERRSCQVRAASGSIVPTVAGGGFLYEGE